MHTRTHTTIIDVNYEYGLQGPPFCMGAGVYRRNKDPCDDNRNK